MTVEMTFENFQGNGGGGADTKAHLAVDEVGSGKHEPLGVGSLIVKVRAP